MRLFGVWTGAKAVALAAALVMVATTPASAGDGKPLPGEQAPSVSTTDLTPEAGQGQGKGQGQGGVDAQLAIGVCTGTTHDPHRSYSFASVHSQTDCPMVVPMIVSVNLLRERWWGWENMANGYKSGTAYQVNGFAKWYCAGAGTFTYRGSGYHRATVGGTNLIGYTANDNRFAC